MAQYRKQLVTVVTDSSGDGIGYSTAFSGLLDRIVYVSGHGVGADIVVTSAETAQVAVTALNITAGGYWSPRLNIVYPDGSGGVLGQEEISFANERVKITVASGGNITTGTFWVYYTQ